MIDPPHEPKLVILIYRIIRDTYQGISPYSASTPSVILLESRVHPLCCFKGDESHDLYNTINMVIGGMFYIHICKYKIIIIKVYL
uniref:Uncharacterized protein n=1 Tax=Lepeophtheirus salmonis TaxID=72036 RepID=A0A0K2V8K6_LEPSM